MNYPSKFIVFEGIDGAGKTTQIELLRKALSERGILCNITAEPTSLPSGKRLREALSGRVKKTALEMAEMFALDRVNHNTDEESGISALLEKGSVICDRYYYSSLAYQGSELGFDTVAKLNLSDPSIRRPDICIFLDLTPSQSLERIGKRGEEKEIYENHEYLTKTRQAFFDTFEKLKKLGENIKIVDAYGSIEEVAERILKEILPIYN